MLNKRKIKRHLKVRFRKKSKLLRFGRVRPLILAILVIIIGILADNDWWIVGLVMLISLFIGGYYRYRTPH